MPTLEDMRRWARGERVEGMPVRRHAGRPSRQDVPTPPVVAGARESKQYKLNADGTDALILFGTQFRGKRLSEIIPIPRGRKYILWILGRDFDEAFKAVCRYQMELHKRAK